MSVNAGAVTKYNAAMLRSQDKGWIAAQIAEAEKRLALLIEREVSLLGTTICAGALGLRLCSGQRWIV